MYKYNLKRKYAQGYNLLLWLITLKPLYCYTKALINLLANNKPLIHIIVQKGIVSPDLCVTFIIS
jgi:hypothetical protein